jgi:hypothetical protein
LATISIPVIGESSLEIARSCRFDAVTEEKVQALLGSPEAASGAGK